MARLALTAATDARASGPRADRLPLWRGVAGSGMHRLRAVRAPRLLHASARRADSWPASTCSEALTPASEPCSRALSGSRSPAGLHKCRS
jgi:hypothetical protein